MKNTLYPVLLLLLVVALSCRNNTPAPSAPDLSMQELVLKNAYEIQDAVFEEEPLEPSGIVGRNDSLFFISDNHDQSIFLLEKIGNAMQWKEEVRFKAPMEKMDIEGLAMDTKGAFYLVSEKHNQILRLDNTSKELQLIGKDIKTLLTGSSTLLEKKNAKFEGITLRNDSTFLLAAERSDRGLVEVQLDSNGVLTLIKAQTYNRSDIGEALRMAGTFDFADVFYFKDQVYVLDRNAQCIIRLDEQNYEAFEAEIWSYKEAAKSYGFKGKGFTEMGTAEGLFITDSLIYLTFDNNKRVNKHFKSTNPTLLVFETPQ